MKKAHLATFHFTEIKINQELNMSNMKWKIHMGRCISERGVHTASS